MPIYDFKCKSGHTFERLVASNKRYSKCGSCSSRAERVFPTSFNIGNVTDVSGTRFKGWEIALGERPTDTRSAEKLLKEKKAVPEEEFRYTKPEKKYNEITEKELGEVMVEKLGEI